MMRSAEDAEEKVEILERGNNGVESNSSHKTPFKPMFKRRSHGQLFHTCTALPEYFSRMIDYRQMDLDSTFYQMVTLCVNPSKVYKSAYYRKQTKNRWARDDPAFAVILVIFLIVASIAWGIAFRVTSFKSCVLLILHAVIVEWLGFGLFLATTFWWIANNYLRIRSSHGMGDIMFVEQEVEWQYAFDIHCNSFFVLFLIVDVIQMFFIPLLVNESFVALLIGNTFYALACGLYFYITFLGYMALPFLQQTEKLLYPIMGICGIYLSTIVLKVLFGATFNCSLMSVNYYYR